MAFHKCKKRNRWVFGGNRSGKTECGAVEAVWMARGVHPYRKNRQNVFGWVVSLSQQVQRDVAQKKILSYLRPDQIVDIVMLSGRKDSPSSGVIDQIVVRNEQGGTGVIALKAAIRAGKSFKGVLSISFGSTKNPQRHLRRVPHARLRQAGGYLRYDDAFEGAHLPLR